MFKFYIQRSSESEANQCNYSFQAPNSSSVPCLKNTDFMCSHRDCVKYAKFSRLYLTEKKRYNVNEFYQRFGTSKKVTKGAKLEGKIYIIQVNV